jgi:hypothetical protein
MNQALYAHMNNKRKMKKKKEIWAPSLAHPSSGCVTPGFNFLTVNGDTPHGTTVF